MSPRQKIIKLGKGQFRVFWEGKEKQALRLNFNPLIEVIENKDSVILHWQGRPFGLRRWGVYCIQSDTYYGIDADKLNLKGCPKTIQIPELQNRTIPTAVLVFENCKVIKKGEVIYLE